VKDKMEEEINYLEEGDKFYQKIISQLDSKKNDEKDKIILGLINIIKNQNQYMKEVGRIIKRMEKIIKR